MPLEYDRKEIKTAYDGRPLYAYTGGMGHACALLTQRNEPLYVYGHHIWWLVLFGFNFAVLLIGLLIATIRGLLHDHSDRGEIKKMVLDLLLVLGSALFLIWLNEITATTRLLLPQFAPLMVARLLELLGVITLAGIHLWKHKPQGKAPAATHAQEPK